MTKKLNEKKNWKFRKGLKDELFSVHPLWVASVSQSHILLAAVVTMDDSEKRYLLTLTSLSDSRPNFTFAQTEQEDAQSPDAQ
ncbi:hypothetical protein OSTOST_04649 [Ostertagia ostertagi]